MDPMQVLAWIIYVGTVAVVVLVVVLLGLAVVAAAERVRDREAAPEQAEAEASPDQAGHMGRYHGKHRTEGDVRHA